MLLRHLTGWSEVNDENLNQVTRPVSNRQQTEYKPELLQFDAPCSVTPDVWSKKLHEMKI
jgi:hypothetical protein